MYIDLENKIIYRKYRFDLSGILSINNYRTSVNIPYSPLRFQFFLKTGKKTVITIIIMQTTVICSTLNIVLTTVE